MKTNLDGFTVTDEKLEAEGIEFEYGPVIFTLRRFGGRNPKLKASYAKHFKPNARAIEMKTIEESKLEDITIRAFIDSCLVKWEGLKGEDGNEIPCTPETAYKLFKERLELFNTLFDYARDHKNFLKDEFFQAESMGN